MKKLLLVEDDKTLGLTLSERLQKAGHEVFWATTGQLAKKYFNDERLDLVILDVGLPDQNGFDLAHWMRTIPRCPPIVFVTAQAGAEDRLRGYELGADEYIPKPFHLKEFLLRVEHVLKNHSVLSVLDLGELKVDFSAMRLERAGQVIEYLTPRESQVLELLVRVTPTVVSRDVILNQVWGEDKFPSSRTVDNTVLRLRQALGAPFGSYIRSIRGVGYCWSVTSVREEEIE